MGTPRWQMREFEQQQLVEALFDAVTDRADAEENLGWDACLYRVAKVLFCALPRFRRRVDSIRESITDQGDTRATIEMRKLADLMQWNLEATGIAAVHAIFTRTAVVIATICRFSKTAGEAEYLLWRFHARLLQSLQSRFTRAHDRERVHKQERLYGGPSTDDVPAEEHDRRSVIAENSESLLVKVV